MVVLSLLLDIRRNVIVLRKFFVIDNYISLLKYIYNNSSALARLISIVSHVSNVNLECKHVKYHRILYEITKCTKNKNFELDTIKTGII